MNEEPHLYEMTLNIMGNEWSPSIKIISYIGDKLNRIVNDFGETLKDIIEEDMNECSTIWFRDHPPGVFDCLIRWEPRVYHYDEGDEYDVAFDIVEEKIHE